MREWQRPIRDHAGTAYRYLQVARLLPRSGLLVPLLPPAATLLLAAGGWPAGRAVVGMVLGALAAWGMAWSLYDLVEARQGAQGDSLVAAGVLTPPQGFWLAVVLGLLALLCALVLGGKVVALAPLALLVAGGYPWLRRRSYLVDGAFGLGIAWGVPLAYAAAGRWPDKVAALLAVTTLLWATGWHLLRGWAQQGDDAQHGLRSLGQMFGPGTGYLVMGLQLATLLGWWLTGVQAELGSAYSTGLLGAVLLVGVEIALLRRGPAAVAQALVVHQATAGAIVIATVLHHLYPSWSAAV